MSLDIRLTVENEANVVDKNITHNLTRMWKEAGVYEVLYKSDGKVSNEVLPTLKHGLKQLLTERERFKQDNRSNGARHYKIAILWLAVLVEELIKYPDGTIRIDR
ncbi:hypothetical protein C0Q44_28130 [Paenibacillus sp. PCH8]|uniref:hypothetical protein n=1 Tax=Paenibacillus sp. PCH8 TaxID=2066524 RepID=UPI000CF84D7E|nr:hypothetical protein [Paenibacillus sp. PCH8]PQP80284.1 hypothetical protein C0Q44_28130 [Paenibacillus sp. PCH8]